MSAIKVKITQFTGSPRSTAATPMASPPSFAAWPSTMRALKVEVAGVHDFTDNSSGVAGAGIVGLPIPAAAIDATAGWRRGDHGAQHLARQDAERRPGDHEHDQRSLGAARPAGQRLGVTGVQAAADTIPALDKASTAQNGANAVSYASAVAAFKVAAGNLNSLIYGANAVLVAVGAPALKTARPVGTPESLTLAAIPAAVAVTAEPSAVAKADVDAFLAAYANNVATLAAAWNAAMKRARRPGRAPRGCGLRTGIAQLEQED